MAPIQSLLCGTLSVISLLKSAGAIALPRNVPANAHIKRDLTTLASSYDYIVVGGGTSGLVVANRLTEDSSKSVLVVEYGDIDDGSEELSIPYNANSLHYDKMFNITSTPQAGIGGRTYAVLSGAVVGGGSAVNGMFFDRGSADDYNAWEQLGNPGWGWKDLFPYFKKSATIWDPSTSAQSQYNFKYNKADYGNGPVQAGFPPFQWPENAIEWKAWPQLGVKTLDEGGADGDAVGAYWVPNSLDKNMTRSYARPAYYDPAASRSNLHLLVKHYAASITFSGTTATGVKIGSVDAPGSLTTVTAKKEVILAAGSIKTPQLLKLSGVGPKEELQPLGLNTVVDLPGVGMNFQDHPAMYVIYSFNNDTTPNPDMLTNNPAYYNASYAQYISNRTGPLTEAHGNSAAFLSLQTIDNNVWQYVWNATMQNPWQYLPAAYNNDSSLLAGYIAQKLQLMKAYLSDDSAIMEFPFGGGAVQTLALEKPLSRGTITINTTDPLANPVVDYGVLTNPVDAAISVAMLKFARKFMATNAMKTLSPLELVPGAAVTSDADLDAIIRSSLMTPTFAHPSCSCSMMPKVLGGVVSPQLLVYGTKQLSIVDASIMPLVPSTHLQATVYAVAEKAADIIKARV